MFLLGKRNYLCFVYETDYDTLILMHVLGNDVKVIQKKIDDLQGRYTDLKNKVTDTVEQMEEALPMAKNFNEAHAKFLDWVLQMEPKLRAKEATGPEAEEQVQVKNHSFHPYILKILS